MHTVSRGTPPPERVAGLLEALGSFGTSRTGRNLNPYFSCRAPERDRRLLEVLRDALGGIGRVYPEPRSGWLWRVNRRDELAALVDHFELHPPLGSKRALFRIWRTLVRIKASRFRDPPRERLEALARRLADLQTCRRRARGAPDGDPPG